MPIWSTTVLSYRSLSFASLVNIPEPLRNHTWVKKISVWLIKLFSTNNKNLCFPIPLQQADIQTKLITTNKYLLNPCAREVPLNFLNKHSSNMPSNLSYDLKLILKYNQIWNNNTMFCTKRLEWWITEQRTILKLLPANLIQ